jgi:hypothetical protein
MASEQDDTRMASEQDDTRKQQLEALRRYMVRLDSQWEPPTELGLLRERLDHPKAAGRRRPPLSWPVLSGLLVVAALVGGLVVGAVAWSDDRPARDTPNPAASAGQRSGSPVATQACKTAVDRANTMLATAIRLRGALAEQDRILNDPANRNLPVGQVLQKLAATQQVGSSESARFAQALDAYRQVVDQCDLRTP